MRVGLLPRLLRNFDGACFSDVFRLFEFGLAGRDACRNFDGACFLGIFRFKTNSRGAAEDQRKTQIAKNVGKTSSIVILLSAPRRRFECEKILKRKKCRKNKLHRNFLANARGPFLSRVGVAKRFSSGKCCFFGHLIFHVLPRCLRFGVRFGVRALFSRGKNASQILSPPPLPPWISADFRCKVLFA